MLKLGLSPQIEYALKAQAFATSNQEKQALTEQQQALQSALTGENKP